MNVEIVAYADDIVVVIVAIHINQINQLVHRLCANLPIYGPDTRDAEKNKSIKFNIGEVKLTPKPYIRCLSIIIDSKFNFKQLVEHVSKKASMVRHL